MRSQKELILATKPFVTEDRAKTWRLLFSTFVALGIALSGAVMAPVLPIKLVFALCAGLIWTRVFIFFHDYQHKAILWDSTPGAIIMNCVGFMTLTPPSVWRQTHDYHHQNNTKMLGAQIGSYPLVSIGIYKALTPAQQKMYAFARHPLTIFFGYFTVFLGGMCLAAFKRAPREHWQGLANFVTHFSMAGLLTWFFGFETAFVVLIFPNMVASAFGGYLFYAQHNFPDIKIKGRRDWNYAFAALRGSSMMEMSPLMHWVTGNIGYHHVHHLNHKIPFYNLPAAMDAIPELQDPGRTSLIPSDMWACMRLKLWDPDRNRMVTWDEAFTETEAKAQAV